MKSKEWRMCGTISCICISARANTKSWHYWYVPKTPKYFLTWNWKYPDFVLAPLPRCEIHTLLWCYILSSFILWACLQCISKQAQELGREREVILLTQCYFLFLNISFNKRSWLYLPEITLSIVNHPDLSSKTEKDSQLHFQISEAQLYLVKQ